METVTMEKSTEQSVGDVERIEAREQLAEIEQERERLEREDEAGLKARHAASTSPQEEKMKMKRATIDPREARQMIDEMPTPLRTPKDDTFIKLYVRVLRHEVPVRRARVRLADIVPFDPPSVDRVRLFLREQPSVVAGLAAGLKSGQHGMTLYRNLAGELVMSDDYCAFVVATDLGLERVNAAIFGEAFETAS